MRTVLLALLVGILSILGCGTAGADEGSPVPDSLTLTGTVVYRERMALPPEAVLTVTLEDVSLADAPAVTLGQTQFQLRGQQVPIPFSLIYPKSAVKPGATYAVRARINLGEQLLFTTTDRNQVDPLNPAPVELLMSRVTTDAPPVADVSLTETYWKLVDVAGQPVSVSESTREPHLVLQSQDNRFHGSGGVNNVMGGFTQTDTALVFSNVASTMMAGPPEAMAQEQAIIAALGRVRGFRIAGDQLTLLDEAGTPVFKAVAVALR